MTLKYKGHTFDVMPHCVCCDVKSGKQVAMIDPTGTKPIRTRFRADTRIKWQMMRTVVREMLVTNDLLQLKAGGLLSVTNPAIVGGASKVSAFQAWIDMALNRIMLEMNGTYMRPFIRSGYNAGQAFAQSVIGTDVVHVNAQAREDLIHQIAVIELQGIMEAVSQQAVRAVAMGINGGLKPLQIVRNVWGVIDKIGITRTRQMIELLVVKAYSDATLDVYAAVGITDVGLIPEAKAARIITDAVKKTRQVKKTTRTGAGSRASRTQTPSASTIGRIEEQEEALERLGGVFIRTAGDEDVCKVCEKLAAGGPYKIDRARSLIPAHPNCRCIFIPANDKRFTEAKRHAARKKAATEAKAPSRRTAGEVPIPIAPSTVPGSGRQVRKVNPNVERIRKLTPQQIAAERRALAAREAAEEAAKEAQANQNAVGEAAELEGYIARQERAGKKVRPELRAKLKRLKARARKAL